MTRGKEERDRKEMIRRTKDEREKTRGIGKEGNKKEYQQARKRYKMDKTTGECKEEKRKEKIIMRTGKELRKYSQSGET